jgi:hypothetical protein
VLRRRALLEKQVSIGIEALLIYFWALSLGIMLAGLICFPTLETHRRLSFKMSTFFQS